MSIVGSIFLLLFLSGCMRQVKVTYIPRNTGVSRDLNNTGRQIAISDLSVQKRSPQKNICQEYSQSSYNEKLKEYLFHWKGVKYRRGGRTSKGIDCSALTQLTYKNIYGVDLPRTVVGQSREGVRIEKSSLLPGDLVFFKTGLRSRHVGIYIGDNTFIHASRSKGVTSSNLNNGYWRRKFWQAKRFPPKIRRQQEKIIFKG